MSLESLLSISLQVADALAAASRSRDHPPRHKSRQHQSSRAHGQAKVLDFGLAKLLEHEAEVESDLTLSGVVIGTPNSMSPEQARGERADERSDIFFVRRRCVRDGHRAHSVSGKEPRRCDQRVAQGRATLRPRN